MLRSGCWCEEGTQPAPAPEISSCCSIQGNRGVAGMESTEGRAEWISTSSPCQCPGDATPCPSESLSLQRPRELLFIHLLLLLVDAGVGDGVSPVERRDSTEGTAQTVPTGAWLSVPEDSRTHPHHTCWPSPLPKPLSAPPNSCRDKSGALSTTRTPRAQGVSNTLAGL